MLYAAHVFDGTAFRSGVRLAIADGRVSGIEFDTEPQVGDTVLPNGLLVPGFIDVQINGYVGVDFAAADETELVGSLSALAKTGTTACLPTIITAPIDELLTSLDVIASLMKPDTSPAAHSRVLGTHVEGPFLSERRKGAHRAELMRDPTADAIGPLLTHPATSLLTLAPERDHGLDAIRSIVDAGRIASIGHTDATGEQVHNAAAAGARMVTHLFNAQRPIGHKEPGVAGAALVDDRLYLGLIADLHHVTPDMVRLTFAAAADRVILVTDALASTGMPPGVYELGGESIVVDELGLPARRLDGTLSGSGLSLVDAVKNVVSLGIPLESALAASTSTPAQLLGRDDIGRIAPGALADLVLLTPELNVASVWLGGQLV